MTADRTIYLEFSNPLDFPSTREFILDNEKENYKLLNVMMLSGEDESVDPNLLAWTISKVTSQ